MNWILLVWSCFCVVTDCCSLFQPVLACYSMFGVIFVLQIKTLQNILICKVIKYELHVWCYYKVEQVLIQADADLMCYKVERALLQSGASSITKSGNLYKIGQYNLPGDWHLFLGMPEKLDFCDNYEEEEMIVSLRNNLIRGFYCTEYCFYYIIWKFSGSYLLRGVTSVTL